jgi:hypothetical protein
LNYIFQIQEDMTLWNMKLSPTLVDFKGRILPCEEIIQGGDCRVKAGNEADWTKALRNSSMLCMGKLHTWAVIYCSNMKRDVQAFVGTLAKSASSLKFPIPQPH